MADFPPWQLVLQIRFDLLYHVRIFRFAKFGLARVHGEHSAPLETIPILWHEVDMQVAASVPIRAVVDFLGVEDGMNSFRRTSDILDESGAFFLADVNDLADVIFVGYDTAARVALLPEQDELAYLQFTDEDAKRVQQFAAHAISAFAAWGFLFGHCSSLFPDVLSDSW